MKADELEKARKRILERVIREANKEDASSEDKNFAKLIVAQRAVQDKMYDIGKKVLIRLAFDKGEKAENDLASLAEYYELLLAGLETFEKALEENQ